MTWFFAAWRFIASSRVVQGILGVIALIGWHMWQVGAARREGRDAERKEAESKAVSRRADVHNQIEAERTKQRTESAQRNQRETGRDGMDNDW